MSWAVRAETAGLWAPDLVYSRATDRYYLTFVVTDTTDETSGVPGCESDSAIGVATSRNPTGPWRISDTPVVPPRQNTSGCDFFWTYDPDVLGDSVRRRSVLYYGSYYGGVHAERVELTRRGVEPVGKPSMVAVGNRYEGTNVVRRGGWYHYFGSATNCCNGPLTGYSVFSGRSQDVHAVEDVVGGDDVPHVHPVEVEVTPRARGHDPLVVVTHDLPRVVTDQQTVAEEVELGHLLEPFGPGEVEGEDRPVRLLEEAQSGARAGEEDLAVLLVRRPVAVLDEMQVAEPGHAEEPPPHVGELPGGAVVRAVSVAMATQGRGVAQVDQGSDLVTLGEHGLPPLAADALASATTGEEGGAPSGEKETATAEAGAQ